MSFRARLRRSLAVAAAVCLSSAGLSLASFLIIPSVPASAAPSCGNFGAVSVVGQTVTCTYTTPGADFFKVPIGLNISSISVVVIGAGGAGGISTANGPGIPATGGSGAKVTATLAATGGDIEGIDVGTGGQPGFSSDGGGAGSTVNAGAANQVIAGGGGGAGEDTPGGNAGAPGANFGGLGCTSDGGLGGFGGVGGAAGMPGICPHGGTVPQSGGNGDGGSGGDGIEAGLPNPVDGPGGIALGTGTGGSSSDFSGGGGGGFGGGGGGIAGGGGGGGGSTGGTVALAGNGGAPGALFQQTKGGPGGNGQVKISYQTPPPPTNINPPTISGTGHPGLTLTCNTSASDWSGIPPTQFRYEFLNGASILQGPTIGANTYLLSNADIGRAVSCSVSATNSGGSSAFIPSSNSIPVNASPPTNIKLPTISGTGHPGQTLTCNTSVSDWNGTPSQFSYEFRNGASILQGPTVGANTYPLTNSDVGRTVSCSVSATNSGGPSAFIPSSNSIPVSPPLITVDLVGPDGGVSSLGNPNGLHGSLPGLGIHVNNIVGIAATPDHGGYFLVGRDGGVFAFGDAHFFGSTGNLVLNKPVVGMAPTPDGHGYWLVASDGGIFTFGDAGFFGSTGNLALNKPVVGMAPTPDGHGYWLVASDGGVFSFGDAGFFGSTGNLVLSKPVVGMASTPDGHGYWLVASDGGVFTFGKAPFLGSIPGLGVSVSNIVTLVPSPTGVAYLLVGGDGGTFAFPNKVFPGSLSGSGLTFVGAAPMG